MGTSKSHLELEGRRFIDRIAEAAAPVFDRVIAVTRHGEPPWDAIETIYEEPHNEPSALYGIRQALNHGGDRVWILASDYPLVTTELLEYLRSQFERSHASILVPVWHGHPQLLCAGYSRGLRDMLDERIRSGKLRIRELLAVAEAEQVDEDELRLQFHGEPLWNINAPDELERLRRDYER